jgi:hypothetical protein
MRAAVARTSDWRLEKPPGQSPNSLGAQTGERLRERHHSPIVRFLEERLVDGARIVRADRPQGRVGDYCTARSLHNEHAVDRVLRGVEEARPVGIRSKRKIINPRNQSGAGAITWRHMARQALGERAGELL